MSFTVHRPEGVETPLVVEVPHAGLEVDPIALADLVSPARCIGYDADLLVDELYAAAPGLGATLLVAHTSRYVVDLNRAETDVDSGAVDGVPPLDAPHGLVWKRSTEGHPTLRRALPESELQRRLETIYRPYHRTLAQLLREKREKFGFALLLCAHSMPSRGRTGHGDTGSDRADVVPGSRGHTSGCPEIIELPADLARARGWSTQHDVPYRGGFTTAHYGRPAQGVHAVQVELNRRLYLDEDSLTRRAGGYEATRDYCTELVRRLSAVRP